MKRHLRRESMDWVMSVLMSYAKNNGSGKRVVGSKEGSQREGGWEDGGGRGKTKEERTRKGHV
jgi:hypothetical protein